MLPGLPLASRSVYRRVSSIFLAYLEVIELYLVHHDISLDARFCRVWFHYLLYKALI